ncbi:pilus assembly protein CpaF [Undibacterium sp. GrIS 1.8]|uniref:ATPase, T2SS/T4P/T4SS family n=1 Tax=Undibacterium sp. GrIS 1.8 TaxID=3143934 RepID=UPI003394CFE3
MIRVQVFFGDDLVGDVTSPELSCFLGKEADSLILLNGWRIGRRQLQFSLDEEGLFLKDCGGMAPIKVNGRTVNEYGPIASNDTIELSAYRVRVHPTQEAYDFMAKKKLALLPPAEVKNVREAVVPKVSDSPLECPEGMAIRGLLHKKLIAAMDLRRVNVSRMADAELRSAVKKLIEELIDTDTAFASMRAMREDLRDVVLNEIVGLGPLESLLSDDAVSEIMVNRHNDIFVERNGQLTRSDISFSNDAAVLAAIERIVSPLGRRIDESSPMVDARLKDGSRVNAIIPPLAIKGPSITIRKFSKKKLIDQDLMRFGAINREMVEFLRIAVKLRANIVVSGGTGSGKTTLLNVLSNFIPDDERIVTVEDAAELQLTQPNMVSLEARPANIEGRGAVTIRDLVKNCLRMRPDRIIVGECRGGEALDMLQAMNTGHDGSLTTAHANSPRDCLSRLEVMTLMSGLDIPMQAIREQISSAVNLIVQQTRFSCGTRKVTYITEVTGIEGNLIQLQDIFKFEQDGFDADGKVRGHFAPTGHIPDFYQDLIKRGVAVDVSIFSRGAMIKRVQ